MLRPKTNEVDHSSPPLSPLLSTNILMQSDENPTDKQSHDTSDLLIVSPSNSFFANKDNLISKIKCETKSTATVKSCPFFDAHYWR
jgi:hypothetical protein